MPTRSIFMNKQTIEVDLDRYEELLQSELKARQYREELKRLGEYDYLINIIEAIETVEEGEKNNEN